MDKMGGLPLGHLSVYNGARMTSIKKRLAASDFRPVLEFPQTETGEADGRLVRFYRDSSDNPFQITLDHESGRVVNTWANGLNESFAFSIRDEQEKPAAAHWVKSKADPASKGAGQSRSMTYELELDGPAAKIGHMLLDSVIAERQALADGAFEVPYHGDAPISGLGAKEFLETTRLLRLLPQGFLPHQLKLWNAGSISEIESRGRETIEPPRLEKGRWLVDVRRQTPDGRYHMGLTLGVSARKATLEADGRVVRIRSLNRKPLRIRVTVTTDASRLGKPLRREEIFKEDFLESAGSGLRQERDIRAAELLFTDGKLLAGLSNYGT